MKKKITSLFATALIALMCVAATPLAYAQGGQNLSASESGLRVMATKVFLGSAGNQEEVSAPNLLVSLFQVINALLTFIGLVFFGILLYAGFRWMNARGNADEVEKAQGMTREAIIGIVIIVGARIITEFIVYAYQNIFVVN